MKEIEPPKCYGCGILLNNTNDSLEHIIQGSLGGHLKAKGLLCRPCNMGEDTGGRNVFAHHLDVEIGNRFSFSIVFPIKYQKDYGARSREFQMDDGSKMLVGRGGKEMDVVPTVKFETMEGQVQIKLLSYPRKGKDLSDAIAFVKSKYRKLPDPKKSWEESGLEQRIGFLLGGSEIRSTNEIKFDETLLRSFGKIALNYALLNGIRQEQVLDFIEYVKGNSRRKQPCFAYYPAEPPHVAAKEELSHILILKNNPATGLLYCYVELFNAFKVLAILTEGYDGSSIDFGYGIDLLRGKEMLIDQQFGFELRNFRLGANPFDSLAGMIPFAEEEMRFKACMADLERRMLRFKAETNASLEIASIFT